MTEADTPPPTDLERLVARDEIRQLVFRYSVAIAERDIDLMVSLYSPNASFGPYGQGPEALRELTSASVQALQFGVITVHNHPIEVQSTSQATGEVWARCVAQQQGQFYDQLIKYIDRYERVDGQWLFASRKHLLWYGVPVAESPLAQEPADWPERQVGVGRIPLADPMIQAWRDTL